MWKLLFEDKKGKMVYGQKPNLPILVWGSAKLFLLIPWFQTNEALLQAIAFGALFTWAWMEMFDGANWFRRILGITMMAFLLYNA